MDFLGYYDASVPLTDLGSVEFALEQAVGSVLWRGRYIFPELLVACSPRSIAALTKAYDTPPTDTSSPSRYVVIVRILAIHHRFEIFTIISTTDQQIRGEFA